MKKVLTLLGMILLSFSLYAKDYFDKVVPNLEKGDLRTALSYLKKWDKEPDREENPNYYICWFNYYLLEAANKRETTGFYVITKKDGTQVSKEKKVPSQEITKKAVSYMTTALEKFPDRLDFYTSRHFALKGSDLNEDLKNSVIEMLNRAKENKNDWYWAEGPYDDGNKGLEQELGQVFEYLLNESDETRAFMKEICDTALVLFPEENFPYYYTGGYYFKTKEYTKSVEYFEKAMKRNPEDYNSVYFLATIYEVYLKNKKRAIYWYEYALKSSNEKIKKFAEWNIERIKSGKTFEY